MWGVSLIFIAVASCNAEPHDVITADLSTPNIENRNIDGSPAIIEKYPFAVQVLHNKEFRCGGFLLTKKHVLTAAHCFYNKEGKLLSINHFTVRVAITTLNPGGSVHLVKNAIIHKLFDYKNFDNDVAVVVITTLVDFNTSVAQRPRIASQGAVVPDNANVTTVGWGKVKWGKEGKYSAVLMELTLRKISRKTCRDRYEKEGHEVTNNMICAGIILGEGNDACKGDTGSPLFYQGILVGITSWGYGCADPDNPGVFARVGKLTNWVIDTAKKNGSFSNKVGAITLLTPFLYLIRSV